LIGYYFQTCVSPFKEAEDCHAFFSLFLVIPKKEKKKKKKKRKPDSLVKVSPSRDSELFIVPFGRQTDVSI